MLNVGRCRWLKGLLFIMHLPIAFLCVSSQLTIISSAMKSTCRVLLLSNPYVIWSWFRRYFPMCTLCPLRNLGLRILVTSIARAHTYLSAANIRLLGFICCIHQSMRLTHLSRDINISFFLSKISDLNLIFINCILVSLKFMKMT